VFSLREPVCFRHLPLAASFPFVWKLLMLVCANEYYTIQYKACEYVDMSTCQQDFLTRLVGSHAKYSWISPLPQYLKLSLQGPTTSTVNVKRGWDNRQYLWMPYYTTCCACRLTKNRSSEWSTQRVITNCMAMSSSDCLRLFSILMPIHWIAHMQRVQVNIVGYRRKLRLMNRPT